MATPAQLQAQAALLEIQIAQLTQQIQSANTPASQQASLIIQRSQLQNDLVIVQQETTALTQQTNPPDPQVPTPAPTEQVQTPDPTAAQNPYAAQAAQQNQQIQAANPEQVPVEQSLAPGEEIVQTTAPAPQTVETFRPGESTITTVEPTPVFEAGGGGGNQGTITRVTYQPEDVPPTVDPAAGEAEAAANPQQSTVNIGTDENRGGNLEAATLQRAKEQKAIQDQFQAPADGDWRVRLKLAPSATYLYMDEKNELLSPLAASNGVVFPYMPSIQTSYNADYSDTALTHSNYKGYFYNSSYVGDVQITGIFTAQDTKEANYLLAVIHFFRSVTKMFYGQDPQRGAPPPLVYIQGLGEYQFNNQPCVVKSFNYSLPNDVDYIRTKPNNYNINLNNRLSKPRTAPSNSIASVVNRLKNALLPKGALPNTGSQSLTVEQSVTNVANSTYVPTKIEIQLTLMPIQTRSQQSQQFSVRDYSNGKLLSGGFW